MQPVTLNFWRVWDDTSDFSEIINAYTTLHPNVKINYRKFRYEEYEDALLTAFADNKGPDIFSIHNTWVKKYQDYIQPMPATITLPYTTLEGTIQKQEVVKLQTKPTLTLRDLKNYFVDTVYSDVVFTTPPKTANALPVDQIYGLPLSVDTLAMYYNRDLLNNAGIVDPPKNWTEFQQDVTKITKLDQQGNILLSAAAIGTGGNISRSTDILTLLMMQNGAQMSGASGYPTFNIIPDDQAGRTVAPADEALKFYTDFASPVKEVYTWNDEMPNSIDAFASGQVAFMFGYSYHREQIESIAPKLNYKIAPIPQIEGNPQANFANYWVETVSNRSKNLNEAWDFTTFAASKDQVGSYLNKTKKPTALRSLIDTQNLDEDISPFSSQILTAKTWYKGEDPNAMEEAFKSMIDSVVSGALSVRDAIEIGNNKVRQTITVRKAYE